MGAEDLRGEGGRFFRGKSWVIAASTASDADPLRRAGGGDGADDGEGAGVGAADDAERHRMASSKAVMALASNSRRRPARKAGMPWRFTRPRMVRSLAP